jgi:hypothetical protein
MQPTETPNEDIIIEALSRQDIKLEELNDSSDVQVEVLSKIHGGIEELNTANEVLIQAQSVNHNAMIDMQKELIRVIQEKEKEDIEIKFEIVGGEAQLIETEHEEND